MTRQAASRPPDGRPAKHPDSLSPMLAVLTDARFSDPDWLFERKLDGERVLIFRHGQRVRLLTRNGKDVADTYPEIVEAARAQPAEDFVADGEIVAFEGKLTSFSRLQKRLQIKQAEDARRSPVAVYAYLFDLLHWSGRSLTDLPQRTRKQRLKQALRFSDPLRYTPHRNKDGEAYHAEACRKGWEGIVAKRADAPYRQGRSRDWLKMKCAQGQELVIGGYTPARGRRVGFGALLVGYFDADGTLHYAGKVGTGFDDDFLARFARTLADRERRTAPFDPPPDEGDARWVTPDLVAEIGFTEWTEDGKLRHPRFLGLRDDKPARDVRREEPA